MIKTKDLKDFIKNKIKAAYPNQKVSISYISRIYKGNTLKLLGGTITPKKVNGQTDGTKCSWRSFDICYYVGSGAEDPQFPVGSGIYLPHGYTFKLYIFCDQNNILEYFCERDDEDWICYAHLFNSNKFNPQTPSVGVLYNNDPNGALYNMQMMQLHNKANTLTELNRVF